MTPIGLLGGTFDPVHNAHLAMGHAALRALPLGKVVFMPTGATRYRRAPVASGEHRLAMLKLALAGEPRFEIDPRELSPSATGYSADTLAQLREELGPRVPIYFLMGADQYAKLGTWHRPEEVRRLARIAVFARPGHPAPDATVERIPMDEMDISASDIRARAARGEDLSDLVPGAVANYLRRERLYG
ncbi:MAG TPA: nicotinate (nicotinamide) nucleotide adenylyltransferase [Burkholderiales bacterium]|nr:nicotinate (nicotinamide) nucleotide adenylyltransferase [Burkholderiales bacterium]